MQMKKFVLLMSLLLLGSAKGVASQPDVPPNSANHQASAQQFFDEYLSLKNPSDVEALYASSKNTLSEHGSSGHASAGHASAGHATGGHAASERSTGEHVTAAEHSADEQAISEHTSGEHTSGEHAVKHTSAEASGEKSSGEPPSPEASADEQSAEQVVGEPLSNEKLSDEKPTGEQPTGEQPTGEQPPAEKPTTSDQAEVEQVSGDTGEQQLSGVPSSSTPSGPVLNCHTCSYMNQQGKCLRGEGVCTTQNSQQCMLKKIFEGGKLQFMVQGCENLCPSMNLFSHGTRMQIICCRNHSFCNKS